MSDMKTAEEKAKECIDNLIDSLSLDVNHEESNYDAGQVHALSDYGKEIYKVGFFEGYNEAVRWRDPKEELPNEGEEVQLKIFDTYHNQQEYTHDVYLGNRWRFCESKYIEVLGWRPIK